MRPLKIGACLRSSDIAGFRDWLFDDGRDIELTDFMSAASLGPERAARIAAARAALAGHPGRIGIHGPYEGLDIDNKDEEVRAIVSARLVAAVEAAAAIGATQMVVHSPYRAWYQNNRLASPGYVEAKRDRIRATLEPVLARAGETGVLVVIENIEDVDPATRRELVESLGSPAVALSVDTGHAQLARRMSGAPPVDYFIRDAGARLAHVHLQDVDGHADRHWAPGEGEVEWHAVFRALADAPGAPHLLLELRDKAAIPRGFAWLRDLGLAC